MFESLEDSYQTQDLKFVELDKEATTATNLAMWNSGSSFVIIFEWEKENWLKIESDAFQAHSSTSFYTNQSNLHTFIWSY